MKRIEEYHNIHWDIPISITQKDQILKALESGQVVYFPDLTVEIEKENWPYFSEKLLQSGVKNISYNLHTNALKGISVNTHQHESVLLYFLQRFAYQAVAFVHQLLPHYKNKLEVGRTSYRPAEILNRKAISKRKDDTLLHVDAFPSAPTGGKRILRLFVNINPYGKERLWRLGEPMPVVLKKFAPTLKRPLPLSLKIMQAVGITRGYRTVYDHYMLQLHDNMKMNDQYQQAADQIRFGFPSNSTWMAFTDVVSHAALSGQYLLEQTFYLPIEAMENPDFSPLMLLYKIGLKDLLPKDFAFSAAVE